MSQQSRNHPIGQHIKRTIQSEKQTLTNVTEIFGDKVDSDVIRLILEECSWKEEEAVEKLCQLTVDTAPPSSQSSSIGLDIIACSLLDASDRGDTPPAEQADSGTSQSHSDSSEPMAAGINLGSYNLGSMNTYDYGSFFQPVGVLPQTSSGGVQNVPCSSISALSSNFQSAKLGQSGSGDPATDKQHSDIQLEAENALAYSTSADKLWGNLGQSSMLTDLKREQHMNRNQTVGSQQSTIASSFSDFSRSCHTHSESFAATARASTGCVTVPTFQSGQQIPGSPHSPVYYTSSSETDTKAFPSTGSISSERITHSVAQPADMALSANAAEFTPRFSPTYGPACTAQPQFCMPKFSVPRSLPTNENRSLQPSDQVFDSPVAQMLGGSSQRPVRNVALNRFLGPSLYLHPNHSFSSSSTSNSGTTGTPSYSAAAAHTPVQKGNPAPIQSLLKTQDYDSGKKSVAVENIERLIQKGCKLLVLMRGLPGSGKSHLARQIQGSGEVFSTDDFFMCGHVYEHAPEKLSDAHVWNQNRVEKALQRGITPVIVDNTNTAMWEMIPYAVMAYTRSYTVELLEPDTHWKFQPKRLAKNNIHRVPMDAIKRMKDRYETVDVQSLMDCVKIRIQTKKFGTASQPGDASKTCGASSTVQNRRQPPPKPQPLVFKQSTNKAAHLQKSPKKGKKKKSQKELTGIRDDCLKLQGEGAREEEIDALIFMANLSENERLDIKKYLKNYKHNNNKIVQHNRIDGESVDLDKDPQESLDSIDSSPNFTKRGSLETVSEENRLTKPSVFPTDDGGEIKPLKQTSDSLSWESPQPQRGVKSQPLPAADSDTVKQNIMPCVNTVSESTSTTDVVTTSTKETTWENPMPQRRERPLRVLQGFIKKSEPKKAGVEDIAMCAAEMKFAGEDLLSKEALRSETEVKAAPDVETMKGVQLTGTTEVPTKLISSDENTTSDENEDEIKGLESRSSKDMIKAFDSGSSESEADSDSYTTTEDRNGDASLEEGVTSPSDSLEAELIFSETSDYKPGKEHILNTADIKDEEETQTLKTADIREGEGTQTSETVDVKENKEAPTSETIIIRKEEEVQTSESVDIKEGTGTTQSLETVDIQETEETRSSETAKIKKEAMPDLATVDSEEDSDSSASIVTTDKLELSKQLDIEKEKPAEIREENKVPQPFDVKSDTAAVNEDNEIPSVSAGVVSLVSYSSSEDDEVNEKTPLTPSTCTSSAVPSALPTETTSAPLSNSDFSRSSTPEKQPTYGASAENSESSCPTSPRRKVRRKKHKMPVTPFLDDTVKLQLNSDSWKSFRPESQISDTDASADGGVQEAQSSVADISAMQDYIFASTQTEGRDFGVASKGEARPEDQHCYKFIVANNHYVVTEDTGISSNSYNHKWKLDKSTMVDIPSEPTVNWLYSCFPDVAMAHLNDVLEVCNGDVGLAVELMFEWGISTPITSRDKYQLRQEMAKHRNRVDSRSARLPEVMSLKTEDTVKSTPPRLVDLCMELLPENSQAIQQQVINSSEQRLQMIERTESQRIRSISLEETAVGADVDFSFTDLSAFTSCANKKGSSYHQEPSSNSVPFESSKESSLRSINFSKERGPEVQSQKEWPKRAARSNSRPSVPPHASLSDSALAGYASLGVGEGLTLSLPCSSIRSLENLFGPLPNSGNASSVTVKLDLSTAHHLYQCLAQSLPSQQQDDAENDRMRQLREDEALAQWLQKEEEVDLTLRSISASTPQTTRPSSQRQQYAPVGGVSFRVKSKQADPLPRPRSQPVNLQDIMDEEMVRQQMHEKQVKLLEATGDHIAIATRLKREKLHQHFPGIDENFLEEIFQSNGYCLESTLSVIEGALGGKEPVSHKLQMVSARADKFPDYTDAERLRGDAAKQDTLSEEDSSERGIEQYQRLNALDNFDIGYQELRQEALLHYRMRRECLTKAHEAHRRNMKDVASFYSQKAHSHFSRMKEANMRASEKMLEIRQAKLDDEMTLDLHGFHVDEAIAALKRVIEEKEKEFHRKPVYNRQHLYVITGRGKHSQHGVAKIRPAVISYLESTDYRYVESKLGLLKVSLHLPA